MVTSVSVSKDYLTFSAAHFLSIAGHKCEALHGHNYVVTVVVEGEVDPRTGFVIDFAVLKRILRPAIDRLDHRVLIAAGNEAIVVTREEEFTAVAVRGRRRFLFPTAHVATVPVTDTTAELLARFLAGAVLEGLAAEGCRSATSVTVEVEESPGQSGRYQTVIPAPEKSP
jgi:6-pyruvoyltetrahydropterin/6-carboxytetrahydropterin synthase